MKTISGRLYRLALFGVALVVLAGCGGVTTTSCQQQSAEFVSQIQPIAREWSDGVTVAASTQRISLAAQINNLQDIRRRAEAVVVPECAGPARQRLINAMNSGISAYLGFLKEDDPEKVNDYLSLSKDQLEAFQKDIATLQSQTPVQNLAPAKFYQGGLGISRTAAQAAFQDFKFEKRTLGTSEDTLTGSKTDFVVEFAGPESNIASASYFGPKGNPSTAQGMDTLIKTVMPDWAEGSAWLAAAVPNAKVDHTSIVDGRIVRVKEFGLAGTLSLTITSLP